MKLFKFLFGDLFLYVGPWSVFDTEKSQRTISSNYNEEGISSYFFDRVTEKTLEAREEKEVKIKLSRFNFDGAKFLRRVKSGSLSSAYYVDDSSHHSTGFCKQGLRSMLGCVPSKIYYKIVE